MNLDIFKAGKIFNPIIGSYRHPSLHHGGVEVTVPARLNAMCFDLKTLAHPKKKFVYNAGELAFSVDAKTYAKIKVGNESGSVTVSDNTQRKSIVKHAALMMKNALEIPNSIYVEANNIHNYPHAGLGSSSSLITAVVIAINEAFGKPLTKRQLTLFISQNHGEEINNDDDNLIHVQCNGGSPSVALYEGGMQVITGNANLICRQEIPDEYTFVFGIPSIYKRHDAKYLMSVETDQFADMIKSRDFYSREIAWKVLHELIPALLEKDMFLLGDVIRYYRFETGSLLIDSKTWKGLYELLADLVTLRNEQTPIVSISSCGPAIYALTNNISEVEKLFQARDMKTFVAKPDNTGYTVQISDSKSL